MDHRLLVSLIFSSVYITFGLYNGLLYFVLRQRIFVHYTIMILGLAMHNSIYLLKSDYPEWIDPISIITAMTTVLGLHLFGSSFIGIKASKYPRISKVFWLIKWVLISIIIIQTINIVTFNSDTLSEALSLPAAFMTLLVVIALLLTSIVLFKKEKTAKFYLLMNSTLLIAAIGYTAMWFLGQDSSTSSSVVLNLSLIHGSTLIQMILFSFFIGYKLKTAEKEKLESQRDINKKLEVEVAKKTAYLSAARDEMERQKNALEENNRLKTKLFTLISHDLRNPLQQMTSMLHLLEEGLINDSGGVKLSTAIKTRLNDSIDSIDRMLKWSYHQLDEIKVNKQMCDLSVLLSTLVNELKPSMQEKGIELTPNLAVKELAVDKDMLLVILRNLVNNAIKFSPENSFIKVSSRYDHNAIHISIQDQGPGMNPEWYKALTSTGKPEVQSSTTGISGTGFGLMIVKDFVEMNGGMLQCDSSDNGTTFNIIFPD